MPFWKEVDSVCKKNHAVFLKVEPDVWTEEFILHPSTFILSPHNIQPPRTIIIDIKDSEETILARMKPKCRYNIRLAEKKDVTVRAWDDIPAFHEMMTVTGGRDKFGVHSKEYYQRAYELFHPKGTCELLVAEYEGKPLAVVDGLCQRKTRLVRLRRIQRPRTQPYANVSPAMGSHPLGKSARL